MRGLKVRGLACPYGVRNCYDETMLPGAFDNFLIELGGVRGIDGQIDVHNAELPMKLMHEGPDIGEWQRLWTTPEGLWCEGTVTNAFAAIIMQAEHISEMSICWNGGEYPEHTWGAGRARALADDGYTMPPDEQTVPELVEHRDVGLSEISLVDAGAFDGTHFEVV